LKFFGGNYIDRGIRVSFRAPWVNHLLFANDSLIFISATSQSVVRLNEILRVYGEFSGQNVNREKSVMFITPNTTTTVRQNVNLLLRIQMEAFSERYLGFPIAVGRITSGTFDHHG
jgi:hypothetical protein